MESREYLLKDESRQWVKNKTQKRKEFLGSYASSYTLIYNKMLKDERYGKNEESDNHLFCFIANNINKSTISIFTLIKSKYVDADRYLEMIYRCMSQYRYFQEVDTRYREDNCVSSSLCKFYRAFSKDYETNNKVIADLYELKSLRNRIMHIYCENSYKRLVNMHYFIYKLNNFIEKYSEEIFYMISIESHKEYRYIENKIESSDSFKSRGISYA